MKNATAPFVCFNTANEPSLRPDPVPVRNEALRRSQRLDPSDLRSVLEYGRHAQVRLNGLVDEVISRLDSGRALRARIREDTDALNRIEPRLPRGTRGWARHSSLIKILDLEGRLANRHDRFRTRMNGLVPRLSDASARALDEIQQIDALALRNDEHLRELDVWIAGARHRLTVLGRHAPEAVVRAPEQWTGEDLPAEMRDVAEGLERLESRLENLEASRDLGRRQEESLHAMRRDLEHLLVHLQTALFDIVPRWQERFREAIVVTRRAQTTRFGRSLARSLDRDEVQREAARSDATPLDSADPTVGDATATGPVALQVVTLADPKPDRTPALSKLGTLSARLARAGRQILRFVPAVRRGLNDRVGGASSFAWWN